MELTVPVSSPSEILHFIDERFDEVYAEGILYRASGVTLRGLISDNSHMSDLFGQMSKLSNKGMSFTALDSLNKRYGRQTVFLGSSLQALSSERKTKDTPIQKKTMILPCLGVAH
jgi:hypothetical protein